MAARGEIRWPLLGSFLAAYGEDLMAADTDALLDVRPLPLPLLDLHRVAVEVGENEAVPEHLLEGPAQSHGELDLGYSGLLNLVPGAA